MKCQSPEVVRPFFQAVTGLITSLLLSNSAFATFYRDWKPVEQQQYQYLENEFYSMGYSAEHRQAAWTLHRLTAHHVRRGCKRTNKFRADGRVPNPVRKRDYSGTGFTRGHLVPSGDRRFSCSANSETFLMSNMSPQKAHFNGKTWLWIEELVREWVARDGRELVVLTGPVLDPGLRKISNGISVPRSFFKIVLDLGSPTPQVMAFLVPDQRLNERPSYFVKTVDEIEVLTGLDFFSILRDDIEADVESTVRMDQWRF